MDTNKNTETNVTKEITSVNDIIKEAVEIKDLADKTEKPKSTRKRSSKTVKSKEVEKIESSNEITSAQTAKITSDPEIEIIFEQEKDDIKNKVTKIMDSDEKEVVPENTEPAPESKKKSTRGRKAKAKEPEKELELPFENALPRVKTDRKKEIEEEYKADELRYGEVKENYHRESPPVVMCPPPPRKNGAGIVMCIFTGLLVVAMAAVMIMLFEIKNIHQEILDTIDKKTEEQTTKAEETSVIMETTESVIVDSTKESTTEETTKTKAEKETATKQEETSAASGKVTKKSTGSEELDNLCDNILNSIINDNMTDVEKARAAYDWITDNISYVMSDKCDTWQEQAIQTINSYSGDCTGYYAILRALFERIGFECESVESITKEHIWVIAKVDGEWYHFDATPGWGSDRFMYTTDEMLSYTYYGNDKYPDGLKYSFSTAALPKD